MSPFPLLPDLTPIHRIANQEARRLCRTLRLPAHECQDLRQDLLVDFLARLPAYNPGKGELGAFARMCFRHKAARIALQRQHDRAGRHHISLDDHLPGSDGLTFADTVAEGDSYAAWCGQPTDAIAALERRLDLERAASTIDPDDHPLCKALSAKTPHEFGETGTMPRARIYRRIREIRLSLLAAGIPSAA